MQVMWVCQCCCSGDQKDEKTYYDDFVVPIKNNLFHTNLKARSIYAKRKNEYGISFNSQAIALFYLKIIGLPLGKKEAIIDVPDIIKYSDDKDKDILANFIRGIFDTDGSLRFKRKNKDIHFYPVLKIDSASKKLTTTLTSLLSKLGFDSWTGLDLERYDKRFNKSFVGNEIDISGKKNLKLWMKLINFHNSKHITKYMVWEKFGFCPPKTKFDDRIKILDGQFDPYNFYQK